MKWRSILFCAAFIGCFVPLKAQQLGQFSQYMQNLYVLNPAAAGVNHQLDLNMSYRQQWVGLNDAPVLYYISASAPLGKQFKKPNPKPASTRISRPSKYPEETATQRKVYHGVGGMVSMHEISAFKKTFANLSYAVHVPFTKTLTVGFGTSAGWSNYSFDKSKFQEQYANDQTFVNFVAGGTSSSVLDITFGMIGYTENWYISYSAAQLLESSLTLGDGNNPINNDLEMHHFLTAGYRIPVNANFTIIPSVLAKYVSPAPTTIDVTAKVDYQRFLWVALSYRHQSALIGMFGANINDKFKVGYSYDYTIGGLRTFNSGSHEVFLGVLFNKRQKAAF